MGWLMVKFEENKLLLVEEVPRVHQSVNSILTKVTYANTWSYSPSKPWSDYVSIFDFGQWLDKNNLLFLSLVGIAPSPLILVFLMIVFIASV